MDQRRYYVVTPAGIELGPYTREELRAALDDGLIDRQDQVRTIQGKELGIVSAVLRIHSGRQPVITGFLQRQPRSTVITVIALTVILIPLVGMLIALHATAVPVPVPVPDRERPAAESGPPPGEPEAPRLAPASAAVAPAAPAPAPASAAASAAEPTPRTLGVQSGTVTSILSAQSSIMALALTTVGGVNHETAIHNGEIAHNAFDGNLNTKYYNPGRDGTHTAGVNTGFVITPRKAEMVTAFQFATANDAEGRDPLTITIEGSDAQDAGKDQGGGFVKIYDGASGLGGDPGRKQWGSCVVFANRTVYRTYRVLVSSIRDDRVYGTQYSEFRLGTLAAGGSGASGASH